MGNSSINHPVLLLHGWPGTSEDFHSVRKYLPEEIHVTAPDLTGFGESFDGDLPTEQATAAAHATRLIQLIESKNLLQPIIAGYDIGSRIAQSMALIAPEKIGGLVITPAYPGIGGRVLEADVQAEFWYQHFHRLDVAGNSLDGNRVALAAYIQHFLTNWSHIGNIISSEQFEKLLDYYSRPGAFRASIAWYNANKGYSGVKQITNPTIMLWAENDPLFPTKWADKLSEYFTNSSLQFVPNCGHFVPLEAPKVFGDAIMKLVKNVRE